VLLRILAQRWAGDVLVRDARQQLMAAAHCESGYVVSARVNGFAALFDALGGVCERVVPARVALVPNVDGVGVGARVLLGHVDPLKLTAAVIRDGLADEAVAEAMRAIGHKAMQLRAKVALGRYGFAPLEAALVEVLRVEPSTLAELEERAALPLPALHRLLATLWLTRAMALVPPTWLRVVPRQPSAALSERPPLRSDEATAVVATHSDLRPVARATPQPMAAGEIGRYHVLRPAHGLTEISGLSQHAHGSMGAAEPLTSRTSRVQSDAHFRVAQLLAERGHLREAVFEAQKAQRLCEPRAGQEALYAWLLFQKAGAIASVWEHLDAALRDEPEDPTVQHYRALLLSAADEP
jgi:hypothetical protein